MHQIYLYLGGVKEEQVLDAFKILFNDNQVCCLHLETTLIRMMSFSIEQILGKSCFSQYLWRYC